MISYERDFHDTSSNFDDRMELNIDPNEIEEDEDELQQDAMNFYRHLDEY